MGLEKKLINFLAIFIGISIMYMFVKDINLSDELTVETQTSEDMRQSTSIPFIAKSTGSMNSDDAVIELIPELSNENRLELKFNINSHSVSLNKFDLKEITTLEYNNKILSPVKASIIGGHHSSGTIVFDTEEDIGSFTIRIKGIPKVEDRLYEWSKG